MLKISPAIQKVIETTLNKKVLQEAHSLSDAEVCSSRTQELV